MIDKAAMERAKAEHGEVYVLKAKGHEVLVKLPGPAEWAGFLDEREKRGSRALKGLFESCCLVPAKAELEQLLSKWPALGSVFGGKVWDLAGAAEEVEAKKV
jgi:hypothetical protein